MLNINFVPDDYIQNNESQRTNLMYLALFLIVMVGLGGAFLTIKIRQRALNNKEKTVQTKLEQAKGDIKKFEELQSKFKVMSKTALTTAELLEPVPRSVLLASLTNNLPKGVSLLRLKLIQKKPKKSSRPVMTSKYQAARSRAADAGQQRVSREKLLETHIDIEGVSPSDLQVAAYIEQLSCSSLLDNVALVESKEFKTGTNQNARGNRGVSLRQFRLKADLKKDVHLTSEDVERIKNMQQGGIHIF